RERLAGAGRPEERLDVPPLAVALDQLGDGLRLVAGRLELADQLELCGHAAASVDNPGDNGTGADSGQKMDGIFNLRCPAPAGVALPLMAAVGRARETYPVFSVRFTRPTDRGRPPHCTQT